MNLLKQCHKVSTVNKWIEMTETAQTFYHYASLTLFYLHQLYFYSQMK